MIELKNVNFGYVKSRSLFEDLNLTMIPGHIYGLLGKNGAGKTTILKMIAGLRFAQSGSVEVMNCQAAYRHAEMLQNIYFLQEEMFVPHLTIEQYEKAYAPFYPCFKHDQFMQFLHEFELTDMRAYMDKMSQGQKKKVLIAFALAVNTPILLMDEPTNGLDIPSKSIFRRVIASAIDENRLMLISTHQVRDLHSLIDVVTIVDGGEILLNASTSEISDRLLFDVDDNLSAQGRVFYEEETPRGNYQVKENVNQLDSNIDLELLFNAMIGSDKDILNLFK